MLPVYRISEGAGNLGNNYDTFTRCREIFKKNGIVLIFSEGRCINEWKLRPLMKGTARIALSSWEEGINLTVLPAGINYQSFTSFGKNTHLNFGNLISREEIAAYNGYGNSINEFNRKLEARLQSLVTRIDSSDTDAIKRTFTVRVPVSKKILLFIPAMLGLLFHAPLYYPVKFISWRKASHNDHYDSVLVGMLFVLYPFYLVVAGALLARATGSWYWLPAILAAPFFAWAAVQLKKQF